MYQDLIDQLRYHVEELEGLETGFALLPDHLIKDSPDATEPSIAQLLEDAVSTEWSRAQLLSISHDEEPNTDMSWPQLIGTWKQIREDMLVQLEMWTADQFEQIMDGRPAHAVIRQFVTDDADRLRLIGERILASGWGMRA